MCCNPANGRVDFEEWSAYKIQLHGKEWIVSLSTDWDQSPTKKTSFKHSNTTSNPKEWYLFGFAKYKSVCPNHSCIFCLLPNYN